MKKKQNYYNRFKELKIILKKKYKRCRLCNKKPKILTFHHLIPNINNIGNLIPLCKECHNEVEQQINSIVSDRVRKEIKNYKSQKFNPSVIPELTNPEAKLFYNKFANLKKDILVMFKKLEEDIYKKLECKAKTKK